MHTTTVGYNYTLTLNLKSVSREYLVETLKKMADYVEQGYNSLAGGNDAGTYHYELKDGKPLPLSDAEIIAVRQLLRR